MNQVNLNAVAQVQMFNSPNYPNAYPNGANCVWVITAPAGCKVLLTFTTFNTELSYDKVFVYDGSIPTPPTSLSGELSGLHSVPKTFSSTGTQMTIVFTSDFFFSGNGFKADYRAHDCILQPPTPTPPPPPGKN